MWRGATCVKGRAGCRGHACWQRGPGLQGAGKARAAGLPREQAGLWPPLAGSLRLGFPSTRPPAAPAPAPAGNFVVVHVSLVPVIGVVGEQKTKPTQHSVATLRSLGLNPALLACRSSEPLQDSVREKLVGGSQLGGPRGGQQGVRGLLGLQRQAALAMAGSASAAAWPACGADNMRDDRVGVNVTSAGLRW